MITLNQLILNNFLSYYGKNKIDFSDKTTLIIGRNESGKSKIFDAFNWVIRDKIYIDKNWVNSNDIGTRLANNKAIDEADGNSVIVSVELSFSCMKDAEYRETFYKIIKKSEFRRGNGELFNEIAKKSLAIEWNDPDSGNFNIKNDQEAIEKINEMFKPRLMPYIAFQG